MLRLIATFILIYLVFRIVISWILPMVVRWYVNRHKKKFYDKNQQVRREEPPAKTDQLGEYVDFEEVKEDKDPTANSQ